MTFGVNIIPKDDTVSLGTSQNKWKINGVDDPKLTDTTYSIINNLTETTTGKVLDATQGKVLKDTIDNLTPADIGAKATQTAVSSPSASGTAIAFIDSISQNTQGIITPTKKTVATATTSTAGLMSATDKSKLDEAASSSEAIKSITRSGTTFTATRCDNTTFTFTQQDNNTTYSFSDKNATLSWGTKSTIATVGGTDIHVTMPSNPNTDHYAWSDITGKPSNYPGGCTGNAATASSCSSANLTDIALTWASSYTTGTYLFIYNGETGSNGGRLLRAINQTNSAKWIQGGASGTWGINVTGSAGSVAAGNITGAVAVEKGGTGSTSRSGARTNLGIKYLDVSIAVGATSKSTGLKTSEATVIAALCTNPWSSVCTIQGIHPSSGYYYVVCKPVETGAANVRVFYFI